MKTKLCIGIIFLSLFFSVNKKTNAQAPTWLWAKSMTGIDYDYGRSIAVDALGNVYTTGNFYDTVDFDPGGGLYKLISDFHHWDIFISKLDASGNFVWAKRMGGANNDQGYSIALDDSGNVYTTGFFQGTADFDPGFGIFNLSGGGMFISKLDSAGNFIWAKTIGINVQGFSIALDASGNVYTTGRFSGTADFDPDSSGTFNLTSGGNNDIFISKLNNAGNFVWAKTIGGPNIQLGRFITIDPSGNVYTTGDFRGTVDFDPDSSANFYLTSNGYDDIFISKLDSTGNFLWAKTMGGINEDAGGSIAFDASGNVYTTGSFRATVDFDPDSSGTFFLSTSSPGEFDIFISKLDSSGNFIWVKQMGGPDDDGGISIVLDAAANIYTTGAYRATADFDPGAGTYFLNSFGIYTSYISKLDPSGNFVWAVSMGGTNTDGSVSIALDASANVHVAGYFYSHSIAFGNVVLINAISSGIFYTSDIFIAKLDNVTGIENVKHPDGISIYPNPFTSEISITFTKQNINQATFTIKNILGQTVLTEQENNPSSPYTKTIDLSFLSKGVYLLDVNACGERMVRKILKE